MAKSWPESQLPRHELLLVVSRRSYTVHYFHSRQLEVASRIERFFHLHAAAQTDRFYCGKESKIGRVKSRHQNNFRVRAVTDLENVVSSSTGSRNGPRGK